MARSRLSQLFGDSPFHALKEHSLKVQTCVRLLADLFAALREKNSERLEETAHQIFDLESQADEIQNALHERLVSRILLPVGKADLIHAMQVQDTMADLAEDIAGLLTIRNMALPEDLLDDVTRFLDRALQNCRLAEAIVSKIDLLLESSFSGRDGLTVARLVAELSERENATREEEVQVAKALFAREADLSAVDVMVWFQVLGLIADLSRHADYTGNAIRRLIEVA